MMGSPETEGRSPRMVHRGRLRVERRGDPGAVRRGQTREAGRGHRDARKQGLRAVTGRVLGAAVSVLPFAIIGAMVVMYLTWWGGEMGSRIPGGDGLLLGIVASVAVSLAAILIGMRGHR